MDIQISSNFERLLYDASGRDAEMVRSMMANLRQSGAYNLSENIRAFINSLFDVGTATEPETFEVIRSVQIDSGYLLDPHTAVALHVAMENSSGEVPMITLSTAHPAKFPATVQKASGIYPALPAWTGRFMDDHEDFVVLKNDQATVEGYIISKTHR